MKDKKTTKAVLTTSGIFLIIIGIMLYLYIKDPKRNYLYYEDKNAINIVVPARDMEVGEIVTETDIKTIVVKDKEIIENDAIYLSNPEDILGKKALYPMKSGQILPLSYFISEEEWYDGKHLYAIEIDIPTTVANSIDIGDYVDINVNYDIESEEDGFYTNGIYENFDVIVSKVLVEDLKNEQGINYQDFKLYNEEGNFVPKYAKVNLDYKQIDDCLGAKEKGEIFLIKYDDITAPPNQVTYKSKVLNNINNGINLDGTEEDESIGQDD